MQTKTKVITFTALFLALAVVLSFVEFPFPAYPRMKFDPALVPTALSGLWLGNVPGLLISVLYPAIHALINGNWAGAVMNIPISVAYIIPILLVKRYFFKSTRLKSVIVGVIAGSVFALIIALVANLTLHPILLGMSTEQVLAMLVPFVLPFNIIKLAANSVIIVLLYSQIRYNFK